MIGVIVDLIEYDTVDLTGRVFNLALLGKSTYGESFHIYK